MIKKVCALLVIIMSVLFLSSCSVKINECYADGKITTSDLILSVKEAYYQTLGAKRCYVTINVYNKTTKTYKFRIERATLVDSTDAKEYEAKCDDYYDIKPSNSWDITFSATVIEKYSFDDHRFYFVIEEKKAIYRLYLYDTPEGLKENIVISYEVDGELVKKEEVKAGRISSYLSDYLSDDRQKYVKADEWKYRGEKVDEDTIIKKDATLSSKSKDVLYWSFVDSAILQQINYVPEDGIIVVPDSINGKSIIINSLSCEDKWEIKELYLPKSFKMNKNLDLMEFFSLEKIYYAGSIDECNEIIKDTNFRTNDKTVIVYNVSYNK